MMHSRALTTMALATFGLALVGCGDDDGDGSSDTTTDAATTDAETTDADTSDTAADTATDTTAAADTAGDSEGAATVQVAETGAGEVVADSEGFALYLFTPDEGGTPTCTEACAEMWPPVTIDGEPTAGEGLDASLLSTVEHPEAGTQLAYNGWPLYYFAGDVAAGDTNGQGQGDVWYVVTPEGDAVE